MVAGAIVGTAWGAFNSWATGGDPAQGAITGLVVGLLGGASGLAGGFAAAGMSIIMDHVNGKKADLNTLWRAIKTGIIAGTFAYAGNKASGVVGRGESNFVKLIVNFAFGGLFTMGNVAYDLAVKALKKIYGK